MHENRSKYLGNGWTGDLTMDSEAWAFIDAQQEKRESPKPDHRCLNCNHASEPWEDITGINVACNHHDWKVRSWPPGWAKTEKDSGGWDQLRDEWDTCEHWEDKDEYGQEI